MSTEERSNVKKRDIPQFWNTPDLKSKIAFHERLQEIGDVDSFRTLRKIGRWVMAIPKAAYTLTLSTIFHLGVMIIRL